MCFDSLRPIMGRVLVQVIQVEEKTSSGIYIPRSDSRLPKTGIVLAKGGSVDSSLGEELPIGCRVHFTSYGLEHPVEVAGAECYLMLVDHILAFDVLEG
jgi:co-chaperonin GroES (HSP10)